MAYAPRRILFLLTVGIERPSGRRYLHIARQLVQQGDRVRILALHPDLTTCRQRRIVQDGVEVWYVGQMHARKQGSLPQQFGAFGLLRVLISSTLGLLNGILRSPADSYHLGKPQPINGLAALIGVWLVRRQPFYLDCDDDETVSNRFTASWQRAVFGGWQWLLPRLAQGVTVNTRYLQQRIRQQTHAPVVYVPNGVDLHGFTLPPPHIVAGLRAALNLEGQRVIAYIGTLALHNHPVNLLLDAFACIAPALPDAVLLLVGGGEDLPTLRHQAA
ncbi:MAG: glycosyltransferase family 4 protein, partial [Chloroflexaceae bacterium]|nr:glycosyltransferase family 4 protein [Chloroflexaceae bacterium]